MLEISAVFPFLAATCAHRHCAGTYPNVPRPASTLADQDLRRSISRGSCSKQLFVLYFGLAQIGIKLEPLTVAILGFGLNGGAYLNEVFRASNLLIQGRPKQRS